MTPSDRSPVTRITPAMVREAGKVRPLVATISGACLLLRPKGTRRTPEALDLSSLYFQAVKARVISERVEKRKARRR